MKNQTAPLFTNPIVLGALGVAVVIVLGSGIYYYSSTRVPQTPALSLSTSTSTVIASGVVEASRNGDLAFEAGGRVASVPAAGQIVATGELLASLDTSALAAARDQASANVAAEQAKLSEMQAPPRQVDIAQKQTAVTQAQSTLADDYADVPNLVQSSFASAYGAVHTDTDGLFNSPASAQPQLAFTSGDSQAVTNVEAGRVDVNAELSTWLSETQNLATDNTSLETALSSGISHLFAIRSYGVALGEALAAYTPTTGFGSTQAAAAASSISTMETSINTLVANLQTLQQKIQTDALAVTSAQNALDQLNAGATTQDIAAQQAAVEAAQAALEAAQAALSNAIITSPFSGTVAAVDVKPGDIIPAGTTAVSVTPSSGLQVTAYFSAIDVAKLSQGQTANITLDAYGTGRIFPATISAVDKAPSQAPDGTQGYKVTFTFNTNDPAVSIGMTANVSVPLQ